MSTNDAANTGGGAGTNGPPTKPTKKVAHDAGVPAAAVALARPWMTTTEVAAESGRHRETVLLALRRGLLDGSQSGAKGHWSIRREDFDDWMRRGKPIARVAGR